MIKNYISDKISQIGREISLVLGSKVQRFFTSYLHFLQRGISTKSEINITGGAEKKQPKRLIGCFCTVNLYSNSNLNRHQDVFKAMYNVNKVLKSIQIVCNIALNETSSKSYAIISHFSLLNDQWVTATELNMLSYIIFFIVTSTFAVAMRAK